MSDAELFELKHKGHRTREQAEQLVQILNRLTTRFAVDGNNRFQQMQSLDPDSKKVKELEAMNDPLVLEWGNQIRKLGGTPRGVWRVDIDAGDGYYSWEYPENNLSYWRSYNSISFDERITLVEHYANRTGSNQLAPR